MIPYTTLSLFNMCGSKCPSQLDKTFLLISPCHRLTMFIPNQVNLSLPEQSAWGQTSPAPTAHSHNEPI